MADMDISQEWQGPPPPSGVTIPSPTTIRTICVDVSEQQGRHPAGLAYPPGERPTLWIKYGWGVYWDEVVHQVRAHQELQKIDSPVRVPVIYYAFTDKAGPKWTYIVMEHICGDTVASLRLKTYESPEQSPDQSREMLDGLSRRVAFALDEFLRIPIPSGTPPASVSGGLIRHPIFDDHEAPRAYENVEQLEQHFNMVGYSLLPIHSHQVRLTSICAQNSLSNCAACVKHTLTYLCSVVYHRSPWYSFIAIYMAATS
ncbi:hypothetical protein diail_3853 [Diaporthe ilicicola]|nr:hypothetical protein diail_3853 [Diaporthe ilicicola]